MTITCGALAGCGGDDGNADTLVTGISIGNSADEVQIKEAGVTLRYPMLSEDNYSVWTVKMKIFMRAQGDGHI